MNIHGNTRSAVSQSKIKEAVLTLLNQKPLEKITVQELVKEAGINRSTFYVHYTDINDLMDNIEMEMAMPFSNGMLYSGDVETGMIFDPAAFKRLIAYIRENKRFYRVYLSCFSDSQLIQEYAHRVQQHFVEPNLARSKRFTKEEYAFQLEFCKTGFFGVIMKWLSNDCAEPDDSVARVLSKLFERCLS